MTSKTKQKSNKGGMLKKEKQPYRKETYDAFTEWSALTTEEKSECKILTAKAFSKKHNIGEARLSKWKKRADFLKMRSDAIRIKLYSHTADVLDGLKERCIKHGMAKDVELFLFYVEGWDRKQAAKKAQEKSATLNLEDIRSVIEILPEHKQKRFYNFLTELLVEAEQAKYWGM